MAKGNGGDQPQAYQSPEITELGRVQDLSLVATGTVCTYEVPSTPAVFCCDAGGGSFNVTTQDGCEWTAQSNDTSWLTCSASGTGSDSISYTFTANTGTSVRTGTITVEGQTFTVKQNPCPHASFMATGGACGGVVFTDTSTPSAPGGAAITNWLWNFGDGSATSTAQSPTHGYASPTTSPVMVTLTVTDANGCTDSTTQPVGFFLAPVAEFSSDQSCGVGSFDASASSSPWGGTLSYAWGFGDGGIGSGVTPTHQYTTQPTNPVTVKLTVTDSKGCARDITHDLNVYLPPVASFSAVQTCFDVEFDGTTSHTPWPGGTITDYEWDYGDGTPVVHGAQVTHSYDVRWSSSTTVKYIVTLTVTDNMGCKGSDTLELVFTAPFTCPTGN